MNSSDKTKSATPAMADRSEAGNGNKPGSPPLKKRKRRYSKSPSKEKGTNTKSSSQDKKSVRSPKSRKNVRRKKKSGQARCSKTNHEFQLGPPVTGTGEFNSDDSPEQFRDLDLAPEILHGVYDMGFTSPTPIQKQAIPVALEGSDIIGCAQTGTGKTAAFALPSLQKIIGGSGTRVLVLAPTRELAIQVAEQFRELGKYLTAQIALIYGGVDYEPQIKALRTGADIVVATPGRLLDHMNQGIASFSELEILILDEADRMLDMGFAEEINQILKRIPQNRQTMLFSATIPPTIQALSKKALQSPVDVSVSPPSTPADGIYHGVYPLAASNKPRAILEILKQSDATVVLIFTRTKSGADHLTDVLEREGISVARIHSDRSQRQRERALSGFRKGAHRVLVATDIVARGIDVTDISHVINYDVPEYPEDYVHRAGRTARAGQIGYALTLMASNEIMLVKNIERFIGKALPRVALPGLSDDIHQKNLGNEPKPLKEQPAVERYDRKRKVPRRTGLSLR